MVCDCGQGTESSQDEKAASAIHAMKLDDELCGRAVQVRVTQGNEPRHFLKMFQGDRFLSTSPKHWELIGLCFF